MAILIKELAGDLARELARELVRELVRNRHDSGRRSWWGNWREPSHARAGVAALFLVTKKIGVAT